MKTKKLRTVVPLVVIIAVGIGFVTKYGIGTTSAIGWGDISLICPLGALGSMLAAKLMVPRAVVSLVIALVLILLFGRAFCAWVCPVPIVGKLRNVFSRKTPEEREREQHRADKQTAAVAPKAGMALTDEERALLAGGCGTHRGGRSSRHWVLGAALASTAVFGFPVFCLICPIGLSFACVLLVIRLFGLGDVTWALIVVPALLLLEVVVFRKWCHTFCPLGALMSLVAKGNRTFRPHADDSRCIETSQGRHCERCAQVCPEGINPRHPELGSKWNECTKCRLCVESCPSGALSMPLLAKRGEDAQKPAPPTPVNDAPPQSSAS